MMVVDSVEGVVVVVMLLPPVVLLLLLLVVAEEEEEEEEEAEVELLLPPRGEGVCVGGGEFVLYIPLDDTRSCANKYANDRRGLDVC